MFLQMTFSCVYLAPKLKSKRKFQNLCYLLYEIKAKRWKIAWKFEGPLPRSPPSASFWHLKSTEIDETSVGGGSYQNPAC